MNTYEKRFWYGVAILVVTGSILFLGALFFGYASDEWGKPPIDEESVPAAKPYGRAATGQPLITVESRAAVKLLCGRDGTPVTSLLYSIAPSLWGRATGLDGRAHFPLAAAWCYF